MKYGDLLLNENNGYYCIYLGFDGNQIKVMYPDGTIYVGCELPFKEIRYVF